ncbi:ShlB/FhaC/HecB family hemolysin secretion/activation protein [Photobacterium sp. CCB-ST2H9]|uniref:ShlB/FhaC/HecB family hemolysin secretion/activation protein n=1 Tax=Photobacterium sp. CCB-ST2H9 TaxID=2912855 RepID=UPI002004F927|nr:ShlB/FhaC/HecB family hemolysin secretion/activation protein [Photobacterium sp. CCB-ST2H9]UTM59458.1 ShlB/FhaC/HecB family hemolysin secretion/activation protein [Photobacterium sp. CCB-ST2H9]
MKPSLPDIAVELGVMHYRFAFLLWMSASVPAQAAVLSPAVKSGIESEQAERLQSIQASQQALEQLQPLPSALPVSEGDEAQCFVVDTVILKGNRVITTEALLQALPFRPGDCIGIHAINNMLKVITNTYVEHAYVTSRAVLLPQDLSDGDLEIEILEGRMQALKNNGQPSARIQRLYPAEADEILNLRDIEQTLDQINRLSRYNATVQLLPGSEPGDSIVNIQSQSGPWWQGELGLNNAGQESTGEQQLSLTLVAEDIFGVYDNWSLSGSKSAAFVNGRDSQSLQFSVGIPAGYWTFGYRYAYSDYLTTVESQSFSFASSGETQSHGLDSQWLFFRDSMSKSSLRFVLNYDGVKNYIDDTQLKGSSHKRMSASVSVEYSTRLAGGFLTFSPLYERGLAVPGKSSATTGQPDDEFNKSTLTLNFSYPLSPEWSLSTTAFAQIATNSLPGSARLSVGGEYSVRGFKGQSLSGDAGYYWRNDLNYALGTFPWLGQINLGLSLDTGAIHPDSTPDNPDSFERGHLTGGALAVRSQSVFHQSSVSVGWPIEHPSWLQADDYSLNYRLSLKF